MGVWQSRERRLDAAEGEAVATVTALREHALKAIETHELLLRWLDRRIAGMTWDQIRASSDTLSAEIRAMHAGMPQVSAMAVTDAEGRTWAGTLPSAPDRYQSVSNRDGWAARRDADQGTYISPAYEGSRSKRPQFDISRRRTTSDGSFDGTIRVTVAESYFTDFWSQVLTGWDGIRIDLVRSDGELLARFPETAEPRRLSVRSNSLMQHMAVAPAGGTFRAVSSTDGVERIVSYARLGNYKLAICYAVTVSSVLAPWREHVWIFGGGGLLAGLSVIIAAINSIVQSRRLANERVSRAAVELAAQEARPLELLGQLAAGTAHDFANILQTMRNGAQLIKHRAGQPDSVRFLADRLNEDAARGASLTQRILELVQQETHHRSVGEDSLASPAEVLSGVGDMLSRLMSSQHQLICEVVPADLRALIRCDRSALEVSLMNLAVNARDAMPAGGQVVIRAVAEEIGGSEIGASPGHVRAALPPGCYVRISVADTGVGMSPDVLARAGELFYTTKPRGTGLGLSRAREFAELAGGILSIDSEVGRGTTVTLWLPAVSPCRAEVPARAEPMV